MKLFGIVCVILALSGCTSSKQEYLKGCHDGIYVALMSFGVSPDQVNPETVSDACNKLSSKKGD